MALLLAVPSARAVGIEVEEFKAKTNAHRLRLAERASQLLANADFLREFPEFSEIANHPQKVIEAVLSHDSNKHTLPSDHRILKTFTENYGVDYRQLPEGSFQRMKIENAIHQLNRMDSEHETREIAKRFTSARDQELMSRLIKVLDFHDAAIHRALEFGKKMVPASQWGETGKEAKSLALFIERYEPHFQRISEITSDFVKAHGFQYLSKSLVNSGAVAKTSVKAIKTSLSGVAGVAKLITPAVVAYELGAGVHNPDRKVAENLTVFFTGTSSTFDCQTFDCREFFRACQRQLGAQAGREDCVNWFYSRPLDQQSEWRRDSDVNGIMSDVAYGIANFTCEEKNEETLIHFDLNLERGEVQSQRVRWPAANSSRPRVVGIVNSKNGDIDEKILFNGDKPSLVQKCSTSTGTSCTNLLAEDVAFMGMVAPQSNRVLRLLRAQKDNLIKCCKSEPCLRHFREKPTPKRREKLSEGVQK